MKSYNYIVVLTAAVILSVLAAACAQQAAPVLAVVTVQDGRTAHTAADAGNAFQGGVAVYLSGVARGEGVFQDARPVTNDGAA